MSEEKKPAPISADEFKVAWMVARERLSDLPNIRFVIEQYIAELEARVIEVEVRPK